MCTSVLEFIKNPNKYYFLDNQKIIIQYGGSVNASNSASLLSAENIDGALVGGASLSVEKFSGIIDSVIA